MENRNERCGRLLHTDFEQIELGDGEYDILCIPFLRFSLLAVQRVQEETAAAESYYDTRLPEVVYQVTTSKLY